MSRWFRHYAGMMRDDKLVRVAIRSKQTIERVCWVWGAILESAAEMDNGGKYDLDTAEAAYFLRADQADVDAITAELTVAKRVAKGRVVNWGNRQFLSDRSKERVAAHRERKRKQGNQGNRIERTGNCDVTLHDGYGNAPETELETDTKLENEDVSAEPTAKPLTKSEVIEAWQTRMVPQGFPAIRKMTGQRERQLAARLKDSTLDEWLQAMTALERSAFCRGENARGWRADFDFLLQPKSFTGLLEGKYAN